MHNLAVYFSWNLIPRIQICTQAIFPIWLFDRMPLHLLFIMPADGPPWIVGDMRRNGLNRSGRHSNCPRNVLVPLWQKDRLLKVSPFRFFLVISAAGLC